MYNTETGLSNEDRQLYEAYYNRSLLTSFDRDLDLEAALNISNQTTTPPVIPNPLTLTSTLTPTSTTTLIST